MSLATRCRHYVNSASRTTPSSGPRNLPRICLVANRYNRVDSGQWHDVEQWKVELVGLVSAVDNDDVWVLLEQLRGFGVSPNQMD